MDRERLMSASFGDGRLCMATEGQSVEVAMTAASMERLARALRLVDAQLSSL